MDEKIREDIIRYFQKKCGGSYEFSDILYNLSSDDILEIMVNYIEDFYI